MDTRHRSRARWIALGAASTLTFAAPGVAQTPIAVDAAETAEWREDLAQFVHAITTEHGDVHHTVSAEQFDTMVAELHDRIPRLARHEIIVELQRIAAAVGDGHTAVLLFFDEDVGFHQLPVRFGWYEEGIFVEAAHEDAGVAPGSKRNESWSLAEDAGPRGLTYPGLAWDRAARQLVLFGGEGDDGLFGQTWLWSGSGWRRDGSGTDPPARTEHAMAYDAGRDVVVLFGGETGRGSVNDAWERDADGWTRVDLRRSPSVRVDEIGAPQYFAVLVRDLDAAVDWYRTVLGLEEWIGSEAEDGTWRIVNLRNESLLVELIRHDEARTVDRSHGFFKVGFHVPDIEAIADRVGRSTGERSRVAEFPEFGLRVLQLRDPDGNIIQVHAWLE